MTRSKQTGPDLFDVDTDTAEIFSLGLVDVPLFDVDTDTAEIVAPEPTDTDTAMLTAALTTGYYEPTAAEVAEHEADEWRDTADTAEPVVFPWEGATVLTVDADLNVVSYPYGDPDKAGAWLEVPQDDDAHEGGDDDFDVVTGLQDADDDDDTNEDDEDRGPLEERNVVLEWTVTKTYRWEGSVGELPTKVQAALHIDDYGDVEWNESASDDAIEALTFGDHEDDTEYVVDSAYEV